MVLVSNQAMAGMAGAQAERDATAGRAQAFESNLGGLATGFFSSWSPSLVPYSVAESNPCSTCESLCGSCNDECFHSKEGTCVQCWGNATHPGCLMDGQPDCRPCWQIEKCAVCQTGSCSNCQKCQSSKEGGCAACWQPDSNNFTCLADGHSSLGNSCTGLLLQSGSFL